MSVSSPLLLPSSPGERVAADDGREGHGDSDEGGEDLTKVGLFWGGDGEINSGTATDGRITCHKLANIISNYFSIESTFKTHNIKLFY